ncbi:MFS transporter [Polycladomyces sp. WAk]|uniref:MFS transporter n=2 Tax=Polycladomyces zharkentensis TaxID=2807616 RepID=A0ABS2WK04_9BACL|nr:MFS transporter [Polycladomyces sp. WAk]
MPNMTVASPGQNADASRHHSWLDIAVLSSVPLLMVLGNSMIIPALPSIRESLGITSLQVSLLITLFSVPAGIVIPLAGILSDRFGRKKIIAISLLLYGAGGIVAGLSAFGSYTLMLIGRMIQGIGAAGTAPIAMALVSDLYKGNERSQVLGMIEAANGLGKVISPILGSLIALISWSALFFTFPALVVPAVAALWWIIREPRREGDVPALSQYKDHVIKTFRRQGKWLSVAFLSGAATLFILFGVLFFLSDLLEKRYGIDGVVKGLILAIPLLAMSSTSYWCGNHIDQNVKRMKHFIVTGMFTVSVVMALVPLITNTYLLLGVLFIGGIGSGLVLPCLNTLITSAVNTAERGIITSLYNGVRFLGVAMGPPIFGALSDNKWLLFGGSSALTAITGMLAAFVIHQPRRLRGTGGQSRLLIRKKRLQQI